MRTRDLARELTTGRRRLYFAYGMNTNPGEMARRCPRSVPIAALTKPDWRFVFRGVADIEPAAGESVFGAMWAITAECEAALDILEGYPRSYIKETFLVRMRAITGKHVHQAFYYRMAPSRRHFLHTPGSGYYQCLHTGYAHWQLPVSQLDAAVQEAREAMRIEHEAEAQAQRHTIVPRIPGGNVSPWKSHGRVFPRRTNVVPRPSNGKLMLLPTTKSEGNNAD